MIERWLTPIHTPNPKPHDQTQQDLIRDCATLLFFYPDTPKEDALRLLAYPSAGASATTTAASRAAPLPRHEEGDEGVATPSTNGAGRA